VPTGKEVVDIPNALSVTQQDEFACHRAILTLGLWYFV
jgi:hypothetical protein